MRSDTCCPDLPGRLPFVAGGPTFQFSWGHLPQIGMPSNPLPWGALRAASVSWPVPSPPYPPVCTP